MKEQIYRLENTKGIIGYFSDLENFKHLRKYLLKKNVTKEEIEILLRDKITENYLLTKMS